MIRLKEDEFLSLWANNDNLNFRRIGLTWIAILMRQIFLFLLLVSGVELGAQSFSFSTLSTNDGLPSNTVNAITQDSKGFIWIATANGLARFDGYRFQTFQRNDSEASIPYNEVSSLLIQGSDLWVGTWQGLCRLNTNTLKITRIPLDGNDVVRCVARDRNENTWIGTANGLIRISPQGERVHYNSKTHGLSHNTIRAVHEDPAGNLWVGTYDKLNVLRPSSNQFEIIDLKAAYKKELKNNLICEIRQAMSDSLLWVGTETGLCLLNTNTGTFTRKNLANAPFSNEVVKAIYTGADGELWLGTDFGLNIYNFSTNEARKLFHHPHIRQTIANNVIWQIFEDAGGLIWIVTSNGLSRINKHNDAFTFHEVSELISGQHIGNQVKAMLTTKKGGLWLATIHGVIRQDASGKRKVFDRNAPESERLLLDNVFALEEDDYGRIWIGTAGGINVFDEATGRIHAITANADNGLTSNYIARFIKTPDGSFWVSAWEGGLFRIVKGFTDLKDIRFEYVGDFGTQKIAYTMNALWCVQNNELLRIDPVTYVSRKIESFSEISKGSDIYSLYADSRGTLWAGSINGIIEFKSNEDKVTMHRVITGSQTIINNMHGDKSGNIWSATHQYIIKLSVNDQKIELFPLDPELPLRTFYTDCSTSSSNGRLLFGGDNGYISFDPSIQVNKYKPQVQITNLQVNNKPVRPHETDEHAIALSQDISSTNELVLNYAQRSISLEFSSMHFWQPEINVYSYRLDGFDDDWTFVSGSKNFAVYSNLPAGNYTFRVRGTNNYGIWSDREATLSLRVEPPLLLSNTFLTLYGITFILLVAAAMRVYAVRLKLKNRVRIAVLEKEHAEEIVSTKQDFFTSISHELRTPISLIIPPLQEIMKRGKLDEEDKNLISIAEKNSKRLLRLINQILDFRKLEHEHQSLKVSWFDIVSFGYELYSLFTDKASRNKIDFRFSSDVPERTFWADKEKVEIIIFNLLSNAFKFTPQGGTITFHIGEAKSSTFPAGAVTITVSDNGIGIPEKEQDRIFTQFYQTDEARKVEDGSGIGLTLVSEFTKMHRGEIKLASSKGSGSTFTVLLPLGSAHLPVNELQGSGEIALVATKTEDSTSAKYQINLPSEKPLVLLAEDNPDMVDFITISLGKKYNFVVSPNGEDAFQRATNVNVDIIISDVMMPVVDGLELCRRLKQNNQTSHIPIILLTAKSLTAHKIEGIKLGADIYMTKPFEIDLLEAHIDHLLERRNELAQYFRHELVTQPLTQGTRENEDDRFLKKVMNSIESNISNPDFGVDALSHEMGMSSTHLYRKLKSLTHLSANEIIKRYRIKKACLMLKNKEGNITEIMYEVGFSNLSYFSKCFKAEFGVTPKEYQQREGKPTYDVVRSLEPEDLKKEK